MPDCNPDFNYEQLVATAKLLGPILEELVFVGGSITGLLITDKGAGLPRPTLDVDAFAEITSYAEYAAFGERLRALGFSEDTREGSPICRWIHSGNVLDVMPLEEKILGFSNRWYGASMKSAMTRNLAQDLDVRIVTAPYFLPRRSKHLKVAEKVIFWRAMISRI